MEELPTGLSHRLRRLADAIEQSPFAKAGPLAHRLYAYGLLFPVPIDQRPARTSLSTSMLFSFALFGRIFSSPSEERLVHGMTMPKTGNPHWGVAVAFLHEALGEDLEERKLPIESAN